MPCVMAGQQLADFYPVGMAELDAFKQAYYNLDEMKLGRRRWGRISPHVAVGAGVFQLRYFFRNISGRRSISQPQSLT